MALLSAGVGSEGRRQLKRWGQTLNLKRQSFHQRTIGPNPS
ncbi:hypothetical protein ACP4OV_026244 [Aristida adscensionis]